MILVSGVYAILAALAVARDAGCAVEVGIGAGVSAVSSETRRPVSIASRIIVWSRRPIHVVVLGAASSAVDLGVGEEVTIVRSWRLGGIARTRAISLACSGCRRLGVSGRATGSRPGARCGSDRVVAIVFEVVVEEGRDQLGVQVGEIERRGAATDAGLRVLHEQGRISCRGRS